MRFGFGSDVRSLVAAPLQRDGRLVGTLALYDKIAADRFTLIAAEIGPQAAIAVGLAVRQVGDR